MDDVYLFLLSMSAFWLLMYILDKAFRLRRYGLSVKPFFIRWDSEWLRALLYRLSRRLGRRRRAFSCLSAFIMSIGFGLMIYILSFLSWNLIRNFLLREPISPITLIVPGLTLKLYWLPHFLIAIIVTVFIHEAAHGILALNEGVSIKSAGMLLLAIFFGGFVELDEEELNRAQLTSKIKIFSAGSASNLLSGLLAFLLLLGLFAQTPSGLIVLDVLDGGPLQTAGVGTWDIIYSLNGTRIRTHQDLAAFMSRVRPGDWIVVGTSRGDFIIRAAYSPVDGQRPIIGLISSLPYYPSRIGLGYLLDVHLYLALNWMFIILFSVAAFNMLPIPLFDGDRVLQCLLERVPGTGSALKKFFNTLSIFLIVANLVVSNI